MRIVVKLDGVTLRDQTFTYTDSTKLNDFVLSKLQLGYSDSLIWSGEYKDLSIYNKVLSDIEIDKLSKPNLSLTKTGDFKCIVSEEALPIPSDAYYWSLSNDCYDITHQFGPSETSNLIFENGSVWIGTATTNMWDKTTYSWSSGVGTVTRDCIGIPPIIPGYEVAKIESTDGNSFQAILWTIPGIEGPDIKYTHSAYIYKTSGTFAKIGQHWNPWTDASPQNIPNDRWTRLSTTITTADNTHASVAIQYFTDGTIYVCCPQYEKREFLNPFVYGTRGLGSLEFNLNSSIGLQWNTDFSIVYWKKPVGTDSNDLVGYNIDSIGCNSNSVGGSYIWWGKSSGSNSVNNSNPGTLDPATYFNNWRMVSLVRSGSVITIKEWEQGGTVHVRTVTGPTAANAYVTQYGYDLKLGGWDNGSACNSYYRDLIIAKRAFTDTELTALYKTLIRQQKDNLLIQYTVNEV
jgi:hypothetical protein